MGSDLVSFLRSKLATPLAIQSLVIISRLFCICSAFLSDNSILPSEFAYQSMMIVIALAGTFDTLKNTATERDSQDLSMQDQRCFVSLFRPTGLSLTQYKQLLEKGAFEWAQVEPGTVITSNEVDTDERQDLYWLQNGEVEVSSNGNMIQMVTS